MVIPDLPFEIIRVIVETSALLQSARHKGHQLSLARVCREFYLWIKPYLYHSVFLDDRRIKLFDRTMAEMADSEAFFGQHVRYLSINYMRDTTLTATRVIIICQAVVSLRISCFPNDSVLSHFTLPPRLRSLTIDCLDTGAIPILPTTLTSVCLTRFKGAQFHSSIFAHLPSLSTVCLSIPTHSDFMSFAEVLMWIKQYPSKRFILRLADEMVQPTSRIVETGLSRVYMRDFGTRNIRQLVYVPESKAVDFAKYSFAMLATDSQFYNGALETEDDEWLLGPPGTETGSTLLQRVADWHDAKLMLLESGN